MTRGYRWRPWKSPYLRWRIETYSGIHADSIGFREFWGFAWRTRRELARYVQWAARMERMSYDEMFPAVTRRSYESTE
jgi:hypothetical protein